MIHSPEFFMTRYDIIVIGGGHAGCEAALAAARMGCCTLMITMSKETIGLMSCNPAVGGVGKGQLVKEIDALGGEMARATDTCGIQFKILNASKGPAVWSSRAQVDRKRYCLYMQKVVHEQKNLELCIAEVVTLIVKDGIIAGVETNQGERILSKTVIVTTGTFLNGLIYMGAKSFSGGRIEEKRISQKLSSCLRDSSFVISRFNTSTCARLDGKTIDFSRMHPQNGDNPPRPFSLNTKSFDIDQLPCYLTYTDERTHNIIRKNLNSSPIFSGDFTGPSVRYCPSFEEKVAKFPHHPRHQIFLEPEGFDTDEYYPNGLFTTLPEEVQADFIHSIPGLEDVKINRFGYGIEYDVVDATQLFASLETKLVKGLFLAGQINGTTGYEEAAAQGLIAGINAALKVQKKKPFTLNRSQAYIGVLIDDLVSKGTAEPYRMFTSRVEYRLILREDNADLRLKGFGYNLGLVKKQEYEEILEKGRLIKEGIARLRESRLDKILRRPGVNYSAIRQDVNGPDSVLPDEVIKQIEIEIKYEGFIERQLKDVERFKKIEGIKIPEDFDFKKVHSLSNEVREKLTRFKPQSLGQAARISGITPVAISTLMIYLHGRGRIKTQRHC